MTMNRELVEYFARFIEGKTGIQYGETNYYQLENRLNAISQRLGFKSLDLLYAKFSSGTDPKLEKILVEEATNHETSFFRDVGIFRAFEELILPSIASRNANELGGTPVRIWSNACSSGQEAYSLSMICHERGIPSVNILCTDLSAKILDRAKSGVFSDLEIKRGLDEKRRAMYFDQIQDAGQVFWRAKDFLRRPMEFREHNLLGQWIGFGAYDIIFIRNVLIYQSLENKKAIVEKTKQHLAPGGYLVMGAAESLIGISDEFEQCSHQGALFYQKKNSVLRAS